MKETNICITISFAPCDDEHIAFMEDYLKWDIEFAVEKAGFKFNPADNGEYASLKFCKTAPQITVTLITDDDDKVALVRKLLRAYVKDFNRMFTHVASID